MNPIFHKLCCLCGAAVLLSGCYRDELASMHNSIDKLELKGITEQVESMTVSLSDIQALKAQITPVIESLETAEADIAAKIEEVKGQIAASGTTSDELNASLVSLQTEFVSVQAAMASLENAKFSDRIDEIQALIKSSLEALDERAATLANAQESFVTLEELARVQALIDLIPSQFDSSFGKNIDDCKDRIVTWVSESDSFKRLFEDYYTKSEIDAGLALIDSLDLVQSDTLAMLRKTIEDLGSDMDAMLIHFIELADKQFSADFADIEQGLDSLYLMDKSMFAAADRIAKLPSVIGDYSGYKSTLIADIREIQAAVLGDEGTLTSLVNTLKLLLTSSEGSYYDFSKILADIATNGDNLIDHDSRVSDLEDLVKTIAELESFTNLASDVSALESEIKTNQADIATLVERVDAIVDKWTDDKMSQIGTNKEYVADLRSEVEKLFLAVGVSTAGEETGIYRTIADLNAAIVSWNIGDLRNDDLKGINDLLANCGIDGVKGLQECLNNIDARLKAIWAKLGDNVDLKIGTSIIDAINKLNDKFKEKDGDLDGKALKAIEEALWADLALIRGTGWTEGLSFISIKGDLDKFLKDLDKKADKTTVNKLSEDVKTIQETLKTLMTTEGFNTKMEDYLKRSDAADTYATLKEFNAFTAAYEALFGKLAEFGEGTILWRIASLENRYKELLARDSALLGRYDDVVDRYKSLVDRNTAIGERDSALETLDGTLNGIIGDGVSDWATDLTVAVNSLYALFLDENGDAVSVPDQCAAIARGIVDALVKSIVGSDSADPAQIAAIIKGFEDEVNGFYTSIGSVNEQLDLFKGMEVTIDETLYAYGALNNAIAAVYTKLLDFTDPDKSWEDLTEKFAGMVTRFENLESLLGKDSLAIGDDIVDAMAKINELIGAIRGEGDSSTTVISLVNDLQTLHSNILKALVGEDGTVGGVYSLKGLKDYLDGLAIDSSNIKSSSGKDGKTIKDVLDAIMSGIDELNLKLGDAVFSGESITAAIKTLQDKLGTFVAADYEKDFADLFKYLEEHGDDINGSIDLKIVGLCARLEAIRGAFDTLGDDEQLKNLTAFAAKIDSLNTMFNELSVNGKTVLKDIVDTLSNSYDAIVEYLGCTDMSGNLANPFKGDTTYVQKIKYLDTFTPKISSGIISGWFNKLLEEAKLTEVIFEIEKKIGMNPVYFHTIIFDIPTEIVIGYDMDNLDTETKQSFVAAINEVCNTLLAKEAIEYLDLDDFQAWYEEICGVKSLSASGYVDMLTLYSKVISMKDELGVKPSGYAYSKDDLIAAVDKLYAELKTVIKPEDFDDDTASKYGNDLWSIIQALNAKIHGGVFSLVNSMSYVPEYADGKATLNESGGKWGMNLSFAVNSSSGFAEVFDPAACSFSLMLNTDQKVYSFDNSCTATYSDGMMNVSFLSNKQGGFSTSGHIWASVVFKDAAGVEFMTEFVPVYYKSGGSIVIDGKRIKSANPASGSTLRYAARAGSRTITFTPFMAADDLSDIEGNRSSNKISITNNGVQKVISSSSDCSDLTGTVSFKDGDYATYSYNVEIVDLSKHFTATSVSGGGVTPNEANSTITVGNNSVIEINFEDDLLKSITGNITCQYEKENGIGVYRNWVTASWDGTTLTVNTTKGRDDGKILGTYHSDNDVTLKANGQTFATITVSHVKGNRE